MVLIRGVKSNERAASGEEKKLQHNLYHHNTLFLFIYF
jgi:hypothetical protein